MKRFVLLGWILLVSIPTAAEASGGGAAGTDWQGVSAGLHVGIGWGNSDWYDLWTDSALGSHEPSGLLAGAQGGLDWQRGPWVFGPAIDVSVSGVRGEHPGARFTGGLAPESDRGEIKYLGTITGRVGRARGRALVFARAGAAWARTRYALEGYLAEGAELAADSMTRWGWTVGGGLELRLAAHWSAAVEYGFMDFGTARADLSYSNPPAWIIPCLAEIDENLHVVKAEINYRF
jgi:outer membrane immunogenic protein